MTEMIFARLLPPSPTPVSALDFIAELAAAEPEYAERPRVVANMVATLDGNASFQGRSAPLSGPGDRQMFHALRASADAIMAGTGTLASERYRPAGKPVVTVTRSGRLPSDIPLFTASEGRVIVFSAGECDLDGVAAQVSVEPLTHLTAAMVRLGTRHGIRRLLCEGGPGLLGAMTRAGLIDELFLTLSPTLAGGVAGPPLSSGDAAPELIHMDLASVLESEGTLFLRYRRAPSTD